MGIYDKEMRRAMRRSGWAFGKAREELWRLSNGQWVNTDELVQQYHAQGWGFVLIAHTPLGGIRGEASYQWFITTPTGERWQFGQFLRMLRECGCDHSPATRERYIFEGVEYLEREVGPFLRSMGWRQVDPVLDDKGNIIDARKGVLKPPTTRWFTSDECDSYLEIATTAAVLALWGAPPVGRAAPEEVPDTTLRKVHDAVDDEFGQVLAGVLAGGK